MPKIIKVPEVTFALGDREQTTQAGVTVATRPLYYKGKRIGSLDADHAGDVIARLLREP